MSDVARQALRDIIAKHGTNVCSDAKRCEGLLRDWCGSYRREINILVNALEERVPLDLLAAGNSMPRELLLTRLAKRLEEQLALTAEASNWAVESWALALNVLTDADVAERKHKRAKNNDLPSNPLKPETETKKVEHETFPPLTIPNKRPPAQSPPQTKQPPVFAPQPNSPAWPTVAGAKMNQTPLNQTRSQTPQAQSSPQATQAQKINPNSGARPQKRSRKLRGCFVGCLLLLIVLGILIVGVPYSIKVMRETQQEKSFDQPFPARR